MTGSRQYDPIGTTASTTPPSTAEMAKGQASQVAGGAADAAQHVAGVAKEQVGQVAAAAGQQVKQLAGRAQSEVVDQVSAQQTKLAGGLHAVGDQLKSMAEKSDQQGAATDLAHQAAERAHQVAQWLEDRSPADLLTELRSFARRRPGSFLTAAVAAGVVAGRIARGMSSDQAPTGNTAPAALQKQSAAALPAPMPVDGADGRHALPAGIPVADPDPFGAAPVRDWTTPRSGEGGAFR